MSQPQLFGVDPIDLADPSPYLPIAYYGHMVIGTVTLAAALVAFWAMKGGRNHRIAGYVFLAGVAVVCLTSIEMLARVFIAPLFMAVFTAIYAVGGAWLALQKGTRTVRLAEASLSLFELVGLAVFLTIAFDAAARGVIPPVAPFVIAFIPVILLMGDVNWFARQEHRQKMRIARHFNRMIWAFVVVLRAPLVELAAAGLPVPPVATIIGPIALGGVMLLYFQRRYGLTKRKAAAPS